MILTFRMPSENVRKWLKLAIKIVITALCIWYISHKIDLKKLSGVLALANPLWIVLSIGAFMFSKLLSSIRLNVYFRNIDIHLPEWKNIQLYWLGMFYNLFLPGSISGDAYKVVRLTKEYNVAYKKTTAAVLLDRFSGLLALGILLGIFWIIAFKGGYYSAWLMAGILLGIPVFYFLIKIFFPYFLPGFFPTFTWGLAVQIFQVVCMYWILQALHIHTHTEHYMLIFLISSVVAVLPFTIGGLGAREVVFLWGAHIFGLDHTVSVMASLLFYGATVASSLPGLPFIFIDPLKTNTPKPAPQPYVTTME
ncbi:MULTISPECIES: lysylphosphatidylglycerol synthase transmembrane domain-containing protein [Niastella]|uniref:Flippase-like domain-containing protein n=1 Tax=Niastella soli TaxID=2821487 RepID=A0ABS3Z4R9_9BACT|nr:lysylphosphatidylglycerol synthase transmembrane domain-containing protein [Niastella soli]MBO9205162.1 flippase-like domain-containing protein [Niastella soli]